ncbi:hypothetical protein [Vreelandella venusta]|uniref:hypothetical protein n=1 Tax=Vreelandella venusta TaxID=44935 RepID=UPI0020109761|nr:hypothetical protein [Halomonas venusta]UQI41900.1 hypothetical protein M3L73_06480 [Halomonas venusta]
MAENIKKSKTLNEAEYRLFDNEAKTKYSLARFGDYLAKTHSYPRSLAGLDAVRYYLMQKHHWTPSTLRDMSIDDMEFAVAMEKEGWTMPPEARPHD